MLKILLFVFKMGLLLWIFCSGQLLQAQEILIYSNAEKQAITISSIEAWEQYRWRLQQEMMKVMGPSYEWEVGGPVDFQVVERWEDKSYHRLTIVYEAAPKEKVTAYLYLPNRRALSGKLPAVLALHPTGAEGKGIVDGQARANRSYAKELAQSGYVVLAPDYPSFGDLSSYDFSIDRYQSGTMAGIFYHRRGVDLLSQLTMVDQNKIGVIGHSLGGHNALFLAAFEPRIKAVVTSCGWTPFDYYNAGSSATERYGGRLGPWAQDRYMPWIREKYDLDDQKVPFDFHEVLALITPRPIFINAPKEDGNFDYKGVEVGLERVQSVLEYFESSSAITVKYPSVGHDFPPDIRKAAYQFLNSIFDFSPNKISMP